MILSGCTGVKEEVLETLGCTDSDSLNYNEEATIDDGSCLYTGCTDPGATNYNSGANADCAGVRAHLFSIVTCLKCGSEVSGTWCGLR